MADNTKESKKSNNRYLFSFQNFIEELRSNKEKKKSVEDYEKYVLKDKKIEGDVKDQKWYKEYLSKFVPVPKYHVPEELEDDFDWDLLFQLIAGSFSSEYRWAYNNDKSAVQAVLPELIVTVTSGGQKIEKRISELWSFQIIRLFEIYCEELMQLTVIAAGTVDEKMAINSEENKKVHAFNKIINKPIAPKQKKSKPNRKKDNDTQKVYFYCSIESAYHILKNGKMFASDLVYMNDKEELTFGIDVMMEALQTIMEDKSSVYDRSLKKWLKNEFLNKQNEERFKKELEIVTYLTLLPSDEVF